MQGEGKFIGVPSVFVRFFGCNLKCPGFGYNEGGEDQEKYLKRISKNTKSKSLKKYPIPEIGCDSAMSWHPFFKNLVKEKKPVEMAQKIVSLLPFGSWLTETGDIHLVLTGGEPLLWQKEITELLNYAVFLPLANITFETNGTQYINKDLINHFNATQYVKVNWSVSPKLSNSGENFSDTIKSKVLRSMSKVKNSTITLKFVVGKVEDFEEVEKVIKYYREKGVLVDSVFIMPEGATSEQLAKSGIERTVADECLKRGFCYSPRLHINLWGNQWAK